MSTIVLTFTDLDEFLEELEAEQQRTGYPGIARGIVRCHGRVDHNFLSIVGARHNTVRFGAWFISDGQLVELLAPCGGYPQYEDEYEEPPAVRDARERAHERLRALQESLETAVDRLGLEMRAGTLEVRS